MADYTDLKAQLRGELILPGDAGYDDARKLYNGMIDKRPRLIARCVDVADVTAAGILHRKDFYLSPIEPKVSDHIRGESIMLVRLVGRRSRTPIKIRPAGRSEIPLVVSSAGYRIIDRRG